MAAAEAKNITWHRGQVSRADREARNAHRGAVLWFTGLSGSGKSTLSFALEKKLFDGGCNVCVLDGDNVRHGLNKDLGFSPADREEGIRRIGEVSRLLADAGMIVITSFISPYRRDRDAARALVPEGSFVEIFCKCPVEKCEERDIKGLYRKARAGEIKDFTGIDAPYEAPLSPDIVVETGSRPVGECLSDITQWLLRSGIVSAAKERISVT